MEMQETGRSRRQRDIRARRYKRQGDNWNREIEETGRYNRQGDTIDREIQETER
jgi:hypothetical protein